MYIVVADKMRSLSVACVCLWHGRKRNNRETVLNIVGFSHFNLLSKHKRQPVRMRALFCFVVWVSFHVSCTTLYSAWRHGIRNDFIVEQKPRNKTKRNCAHLRWSDNLGATEKPHICLALAIKFNINLKSNPIVLNVRRRRLRLRSPS